MSDAHADDLDEAAALEIGRAFLDARRLAGSIVADAHRRADALLGSVAPFGPAESVSAAALPTEGLAAAPPAVTSTSLIAELDTIEQMMTERQSALIELLDRYQVALGAPAGPEMASDLILLAEQIEARGLHNPPASPAAQVTQPPAGTAVPEDAAERYAPPFGQEPVILPVETPPVWTPPQVGTLSQEESLPVGILPGDAEPPSGFEASEADAAQPDALDLPDPIVHQRPLGEPGLHGNKVPPAPESPASPPAKPDSPAPPPARPPDGGGTDFWQSASARNLGYLMVGIGVLLLLLVVVKSL